MSILAQLNFENIQDGNFESICGAIEKVSNELKQKLLLSIFQKDDDEFFDNKSWKENFHSNGFAERTIITSIGEITYKRRYYIAKDKNKDKNFYHIDKKFNFRKNVLLTDDALIMIIKKAADQNCSVAAKEAIPGCPISKQTVYNNLKSLNTVNECGPVIDPMPTFKNKHSIETLYIEDDEAHCNLQSEYKNSMKELKETDCNFYNNARHKNIVNKLVLIHEGYKATSLDKKRKELLNKAYYGGIHMNSDELSYEAACYIKDNYNINNLKHIFVSGDAGKWISEFHKSLQFYLYGSNLQIIPILDIFHTRKYLSTIFQGDKRYINEFYDNLDIVTPENFKEIVLYFHKVSFNKLELNIRKAVNYIITNLEKIKNILHPEYKCHCSMEGHISHVLASRFTSRPMGFCEKVLQNLTQIRILLANGVTLNTNMIEYWRQNNQNQKPKSINSFKKKQYNINASISISNDASPRLKEYVDFLNHITPI